MADFQIFPALAGGMLIGVASSVVLLCHGKIAGISGIVGAFLSRACDDIRWRGFFLGGLLLGGVLLALVAPSTLTYASERPVWAMAVAGVLVGFGTRMGNGCTSGHGVCGLPRKSARSFAAVMTFMGTGVLTAILAGQLFG